MPGYILIQQKHLSFATQRGTGRIRANPKVIGFLDFARLLREEPFPFNANTRLCVLGLEEVLLAARPDMETMAHTIHGWLQKAAGKFERGNCPNVQVVFRSELRRGDTLRIIHPAAELPIYIIFGSPTQDSDIKGNPFFTCSFNLSSAT